MPAWTFGFYYFRLNSSLLITPQINAVMRANKMSASVPKLNEKLPAKIEKIKYEKIA